MAKFLPSYRENKGFYNRILRIGVPVLLILVLTGAWFDALYRFTPLGAMEKGFLIRESYHIHDVRHIRIRITSATFSILESDNNKATVRIKAPPGTPAEETFDVRFDGDEMIVSDRLPAAHSGPLAVFARDLELMLPRRYHGRITVDSLEGGFQCGRDLELDTLTMRFRSGDVRFADRLKAREISLETGRGNLMLDEVTAERLFLKTETGQLRAQRIRANEIDARLGGKKIQISEFAGAGQIRATGTVDIRLCAPAGPLALDARRLRVSAAADLSAKLRAESRAGSVLWQAESRKEKAPALEKTLSAGGPEIVLRAEKNIRITARP